MFKISLFFILLSLSSSLHVDNHQDVNHTPESLGEVVENLQEIQQSFSEQSNSLSDNGELVQFLENVIDSKVDDLYNFEENLIPVLALNPHVCSNLSQNDKEVLVQKFESAQSNVQKLVSTIESISDATSKQNLLRRANLQYLYLEQVKQGIQNDCKNQIISPTAYFYNLNGRNWIYGSNSNELEMIKAYKLLSNYGTVTTCPEDRPFVAPGGTSCFNCNSESPIFDLSRHECTNCPNNSGVNPSTHQCN